MADNLIRITDAMMEGKGVLPLSDIPGLSAETMKKKFEQIVREVIIPAFNDNMDEIAGHIYYDPGTGSVYLTVDNLIESYARIQSATQTDAEKTPNTLAVKDMDTYLKGLINTLDGEVDALDAAINGETGVKARLTALEATGFITFEKNDGLGAHLNKAVPIDYENNTMTVPDDAPVFTRTGYTFLGWSTNDASAVADYQNGDDVANLDQHIYGNCLTLYAIWEEDAP